MEIFIKILKYGNRVKLLGFTNHASGCMNWVRVWVHICCTWFRSGYGPRRTLGPQEFRMAPPTQETGAHPSLGIQTQNLCFASVASSLKEEKPKI